ncbi:MAG: hypothetical protein C5B49_00470 [Bdellovibrio sp.]|nr:MAG: hypothetical protein C5B49_00470 [Bdellovibrio sp.]
MLVKKSIYFILPHLQWFFFIVPMGFISGAHAGLSCGLVHFRPHLPLKAEVHVPSDPRQLPATLIKELDPLPSAQVWQIEVPKTEVILAYIPESLHRIPQLVSQTFHGEYIFLTFTDLQKKEEFLKWCPCHPLLKKGTLQIDQLALHVLVLTPMDLVVIREKLRPSLANLPSQNRAFPTTIQILRSASAEQASTTNGTTYFFSAFGDPIGYFKEGEAMALDFLDPNLTGASHTLIWQRQQERSRDPLLTTPQEIRTGYLKALIDATKNASDWISQFPDSGSVSSIIRFKQTANKLAELQSWIERLKGRQTDDSAVRENNKFLMAKLKLFVQALSQFLRPILQETKAGLLTSDPRFQWVAKVSNDLSDLVKTEFAKTTRFFRFVWIPALELGDGGFVFSEVTPTASGPPESSFNPLDQGFVLHTQMLRLMLGNELLDGPFSMAGDYPFLANTYRGGLIEIEYSDSGKPLSLEIPESGSQMSLPERNVFMTGPIKMSELERVQLIYELKKYFLNWMP